MFLTTTSNVGVRQVNEADFNNGVFNSGVILTRYIGNGISVGARYNLGRFEQVPLTCQSDRLFKEYFVYNNRFVPAQYRFPTETNKPDVQPYTGWKTPTFTAIPFRYVCNHRHKIELTFENIGFNTVAPPSGWNVFRSGSNDYYVRLIYILEGSRLAVGVSEYQFVGVDSYDFCHLEINPYLSLEGNVSLETGFTVNASEIIGVWGVAIYTKPTVVTGRNDTLIIGDDNGSSGLSNVSSLNVVSEQFISNEYLTVSNWEFGRAPFLLGGVQEIDCQNVDTSERGNQTIPYVLMLDDRYTSFKVALNVF